MQQYWYANDLRVFISVLDGLAILWTGTVDLHPNLAFDLGCLGDLAS